MYLNPQKDQKIGLEKAGMLLKILGLFSAREKVDTAVIDEKVEVQELLESIRNAKNELLAASINFEYAREKDMVDYYTYKIKACQVQYDYLIKKAKEKGIRVEIPETIGTAFSGTI